MQSIVDCTDMVFNKTDGLNKLVECGVPVPEFIALENLLDCHEKNSMSLSDNFYQKIDTFVKKVKVHGYLPLFSIRCGSKYLDKTIPIPQTLLNVGFMSLPICEYKMYDYSFNDIEEFYFQQEYFYKKRIENTFPHEKIRAFANTTEELYFWATRIFELLFQRGIKSGIIIQRMVFGTLDRFSGNGICCTYPEEIDGDKRFKGVFLPMQNGLSVQKGSWGEKEIPLDELLQINSRAYFELRGIYDYLETKYGEGRHLEFCVEGSNVYILDHVTRIRFVIAGK